MRKILKNPIFWTILITTLVIVGYFVALFSNLTWVDKAAIALLTPVATLFVGFYALILYNRQKRDTKKDAANIILLEIQYAETVLNTAQRTLEDTVQTLPSDVITMPNENWSKYKYLFVNDFSASEWEAITNFYNRCQLFDEAVRTNSSYFQKNEEQIRINIQRRTADLTKQYMNRINNAKRVGEKEKLRSELQTKVTEYINLYLSINAQYYPQKSTNDAKLSLNMLKLNISLPGALSKLEALAK